MVASPSRAQIALERIRQLIERGAPGERLPSEAELSSNVGVSRVTIREALRTLWHEGSIVRRWGSGTFIADRTVSQAAARFRTFYVDSHSIGSLPAQIAAAGHVPTLRVFEVDTFPVPEWVMATEIGEHSPRAILRAMEIDGVPALAVVDYVPTTLNDQDVNLSVLGDLRNDLTSFLRSYGVRAVKHEGTLAAVGTPEKLAPLLGLEEGAPVLLTNQLIIDDNGAVVTCSQIFHRTDVFEQVLVRTVGD